MQKTIRIIKTKTKRILKKIKVFVAKTKKFIKTLPKRVDTLLSKSLRSKKH